MNAVDGATIELRIRISRPDEGRGRCKGSRAWDPRKDFSQCMQPPRTPSTSNATSSQAERTEPSGPRRCSHGTKPSPRREPNGPGDLLRALFGNVTEPTKGNCGIIQRSQGARPAEMSVKSASRRRELTLERDAISLAFFVG